MEKYTKIKVLGHGAFGKAWLVSDNATSGAFVIKEISIPVLKERDKQQAINEVKILATLKHKNIILYREAFVHDKCLCITMEYADDGDLSEKIKNQKGKLFMELQIIDWFVQILIAVKYIHSLNILHRDLKSQNIFLTKSGFVKIGDFGVSRSLDGGLDQAKTAIGTPYYLSPEICQQQSYDHKSDMWSLGVLTYELATLKHPFVANDFQNLIVKIVKGKYPPIPGCFGPLIQDLVLILLQVSPQHRPSAAQLLKAPSLQQHIRSYLLRVKNFGRERSQERLKSASLERLIEIKPVSSRLQKVNFQEDAVAGNSGMQDKDKPESALSEFQTDSAYGSENEQIYEYCHPVIPNPPRITRTGIFTELDALTERDEVDRAHEIAVMRNDGVIPKRQSYLDAVSSTDQSMIESDLNTTFNCKKKENEKEKFKRTKEVSNEKEKEKKKFRRRSYEVESTTEKCKQKLPRRLSVDGIRNKEKENEEKAKPKRRSSLSTLKKFITRSSKSNINEVPDIKSTNETVRLKTPSPNQNVAKSNDVSKAKQTKGAVNFIERNKKLAETPKSKAARKQSEKQEKQDKKNGKSSKNKLPSVSEVSESSAAKNDSLLKTYVVTNERATKTKQEPKTKIMISKAPLLKKRSLTFDHKETFLKFGQHGVNNLDATELDCIEVCVKKTLKNRQEVEVQKQIKEPKKVRHQSSNVFPDGFRVKDAVKRKIMGRLRASSHAGDDSSRDVCSTSTNKKVSESKKMQHSKTYTVLKPLQEQFSTGEQSNNKEQSVTLEQIMEQSRTESFNQALELVRTISISNEDLKVLKRACVLVDEDSEINVLLRQLESSYIGE